MIQFKIIVFLLLFFLLFFIFFLRFLFMADLPPGPTIWQLWRRRRAFATKPHVAMKELANTYGPLLSFRLGTQLVVVASSPATAEELHKTNNLVFSGRHVPSVFYIIPGAKNTLITAAKECDAAWKLLRSIAHKFIFSLKAIESAAPVREAKAREMIELLQLRAGGGGGGGRAVVNVEHVLCAAFANIVGNVLASRDLFGAGGGSESDRKMGRFLNEVIEKVTAPGLGDVFPFLSGVDFWTKGKGMEFYGSVQHIWGDTVRERRSRRGGGGGDSGQDFLDVLLEYPFDGDQISAILMELLLGATDSTTVTSVWLMAELIKNHKILHKVRNEIADNAVEGGQVKESRLSECPYFEACIKETLRLHVTAPLAVPHRAIKSCRVSNYVIPKDSIVVVNAWAIHTDPGVWEDAAVFKPERFLGSSIDFKGAHFEFIPFGAGSRMCPGWNLALRGLKMLVASLVHHFDWSLPNGENPNYLDMSEKFGTSLKMEKPFYLIPKIRKMTR